MADKVFSSDKKKRELTDGLNQPFLNYIQSKSNLKVFVNILIIIKANLF